jgi:hypothetical protein
MPRWDNAAGIGKLVSLNLLRRPRNSTRCVIAIERD